MRRLALPLALAALLALGGVVAVELLRPGGAQTRAELAQQIAGELRCPDCQALSVAESHTAAAIAIRRQIAEQLAAGQSADGVRAYFVSRYGDWILLAPRSPLAWWIPPAVILVGIGAFAWWLGRGRGTATPSAPVPEPGVHDRIREEVDELDA